MEDLTTTHIGRVPPNMEDLPTDHTALIASINTIILAIEAAVLNGNAFLPTAPASIHATIQQPLEELGMQIKALRTALTIKSRQADKMSFMHHELQFISTNAFLTHPERAANITTILNDIGPFSEAYTTSFRAFASSLAPVLARLYHLLALLATNPTVKVRPRRGAPGHKNALALRRLLPLPSDPRSVVASGDGEGSTSVEVFGGAERRVRGLVRRVKGLCVGAERGAGMAGRWVEWQAWARGWEKMEMEVEEEVEKGKGGYE